MHIFVLAGVIFISSLLAILEYLQNYQRLCFVQKRKTKFMSTSFSSITLQTVYIRIRNCWCNVQLRQTKDGYNAFSKNVNFCRNSFIRVSHFEKSNAEFIFFGIDALSCITWSNSVHEGFSFRGNIPRCYYN